MTDSAAVKFIEEDGEWFIEGLIMPVGGPLRGNDLTGSHFPSSKDWDYCADWFPNGGRPGLYRHGFDDQLKLSVVGREVKSWKDDKGVWLRAQIDKAHEYAAEIKQLLDDGLLSLSSGAVDHLVKIAAKSGEIQVWPWVEWSLVPNPANPEALLYQVKSSDAFGHLGASITITDGTKDYSEAADDASWASSLRGSLTTLLGSETDDPEQARLLRQAIAYLDRFIASETDEIGTPEDQAESQATGYTETTTTTVAYASTDGKRTALPLTAQSLHDAAIASGAKCAPDEPSAPSLTITAGKSAPEPDGTPADDLDVNALVQLATKSAAAVGRSVAERMLG